MIADPAAVSALWRDDFEAMSAAGGLWILTNHPFLSGRPARARALQGLISHVAQQSGAWIAPLAEIASYVRGLGLAPRKLSRPVP
jgi:peptidoglycan/xylan/chitin deacetylase (PgdA/CDA1 family)